MSFAALAKQGRLAAKHQRVRGLERKPSVQPPKPKRLTHDEVLTVRRLHAERYKPQFLQQQYKVSAAEIAKAISKKVSNE